MQPPSILILTMNEESNIAACLRCLEFSDDIVILDSGSTDRTVEIARTFPNVRIFTRSFDTEYLQRNYGLHEIPFKHEWVYVCDADERVPEDLRDEMIQAINDPARTHVAYRLRYRNMYMGRWIRFASSYPVWIIRLVKPDRVTYEKRATNIHPIVDGTTGELRSHFVHYSFNGGLERWFHKHNFYSTREAAEGVKIRRTGLPSLGTIFSRDPMVRRRALKNLSYFVTGRGFIRFMLQYFLKAGFLDGRAGFHYSMMVAMYETWMDLKINEMESHWEEATDRTVRRLLAEGETS